MAANKGKNTEPELALRRALHARGFRYRLHPKKIQGRPDLVLPKYCAVVFVHGCFWHHHQDCRYATTPSTNADFWKKKFETNVARDGLVRATLLDQGWRVAIVWECALRKPEQVFAGAEWLAAWLLTDSETLELSAREVLQA